ncbi:MAG TPA: MFS transporter, partial [Candidatus Dormibacteraeota bacterium]|nr:MFS transporter [Candidatus Dormibacteraeota bacterium]
MPPTNTKEDKVGITGQDATVVSEKPEPSSTWESGQDQKASKSALGIERKQFLTLFVLSLSLAIIVLDATIVIVALKQISVDFQISLKDLEWITSLYALVFGTFLLTWGKLGDEFGRKRIFIAGVSLFILGSIIDGQSADLTQMLVGRVIQGFGAAMASPATLAILTTTFTGKARNVAFGIWGATAGAAAVLGPLLGGYFTSSPTFTWRWAFYINIPIGAVALIGAFLAIKETRFKDPNYSTDYGGLALITLGLSALLFGLIEGQTYGWLTQSQPFSLLGISWPITDFSLPASSIVSGVLLLGAFTYYDIIRARKGRVPLFDFSLLRFPGFRFGLFTVFIVAMGEFGAVFIFSIYFQTVKQLSAVQTGITFLPMAISVFIFAPIAGVLANRFGPRWVVTAGMVLEAIALFSIFAITSVATPVYDYYPVLVVYGAGVGLAISQLTSVVLLSLPWQKAGIGSGANNTVRQVGSAFGIAVIGAVLVAIISSVGQADVAADIAQRTLPASAKAMLDGVLNAGLSNGVGQLPPGLPQQYVLVVITVINHAITEGTRWAAFTAAIFVSFGALSSLLIPNPRGKTDAKTPPSTVSRDSQTMSD